MKQIKRNGDWAFVETKDTPQGEEVKHDGSFIFATGEATNHHHLISIPEVDKMKIWKLPDGSYMVDLREEATVTHPEHSLKTDIKLKPGRYKLGQRREKDWFSLATRKIVD
jgi:hypothetical protein